MKRATSLSAAIGCGLLVLTLSGCEATDPLLDRTRNWNPMGVNDANIAAQVANPADLLIGHGSDAGTDGHLAAMAVQRLRQNRVKALPDSGLSDIKVSGSGGGDSAGGAAPAGADGAAP